MANVKYFVDLSEKVELQLGKVYFTRQRESDEEIW